MRIRPNKREMLMPDSAEVLELKLREWFFSVSKPVPIKFKLRITKGALLISIYGSRQKTAVFC